MKLVLLIFISLISLNISAVKVEVMYERNGTGKIYVPCSFDNQLYDCLLDTGSDSTFIKHDTFSEKYISTEKVDYFGLSMNLYNADQIDIDTVQVGKITLENKQIYRQKISNSESILGMDFLEKNGFCLDMKTKSLNFVEGIPSNINSQKLESDDYGTIFIDFLADGFQAKGMWDTAAGISVVDKSFVDNNKDMFKHIRTEIVQDASGIITNVDVFLVKELDFDDKVIHNIEFVAVDISRFSFLSFYNVYFIIGFNVISKMNWCIDIPNRVWGIY